MCIESRAGRAHTLTWAGSPLLRVPRHLLIALACVALAACSADVLSPGPVDVSAGLQDAPSDIDKPSPADADAGPPPECPAGYEHWSGSPVCVVSGDLQCIPCSDASACLGGACTDVQGEGSFCLIPCLATATTDAGPHDSCPTGHTCTPSAASDAAFCRPDNGSCSCGPDSLGDSRVCAAKGTGCAGKQTCGVDGWQVCDAPGATAEQCNGLDDDCDGKTDNGLPATTPCTSPAKPDQPGSCAGTATCAGSKGWICDAKAPAPEQCNGLDDNCDGVTDEPWRVNGVLIGKDHCGVCDNSCAGAVLYGTAMCDAAALPPFCAVATCDPGYQQDGNQCVPKVVGACDACQTNSDCGVVATCLAPSVKGLPSKICMLPCGPKNTCEPGLACKSVPGQKAKVCVPSEPTCTCGPGNSGAKRSCSRSTAAGTCAGQETCVPSQGWVGCSAKVPLAEVCNGADDDCDGTLDEDAGGDVACPISNPYGTCIGKTVCTGTGGLICTGKAASNDVCNGADDDCDGVVDEGALDPKTGTYTSLGHCGVCNNTCPVPAALHTQATCAPPQANGSKPVCGIDCDAGWVNANGLMSDGCECKSGATTDVPGGGDIDCDGVDGEASKAIFVAKWGNDLWAGTVTLPMATIGAATARAVAQKKPHLYVGAGAWPENVLLVAGVSIYGGYGPGFKDRDPAIYETSLVGQGAGKQLATGVAAVRCQNILGVGARTRVDGVSIIGPSVLSPGGTSYAVFSSNCDSRFELVGCQVKAGQGAKGADGKAGTNGQPGTSGADGAKGKDVGHAGCASKDQTPGGAGGVRACATGSAAGGAGGTSICPDFHESIAPPKCSVATGNTKQTQSPLARGKQGAGLGGGLGGSAGADAYSDPHDGTVTSCKSSDHDCTGCIVPLMTRVGLPGSPGQSGVAGNGAKGASGGAATAVGWSGTSAAAGNTGGRGSGGGGGGSGGGVEVVGCVKIAGYSDLGGSGGGGGAGGCGGSGGGGGGAGGGAIALYVFGAVASPAPVVSGCTFIGGAGGAGGSGGGGGWGGPGASGGDGGAGTPTEELNDCAPEGGDGGDGGDGGSGGGGGGGAGGPAWLVAAKGLSQSWLTAVQLNNTLLKPGLPGLGGVGGAGAPHSGGAGVGGDTLVTRRWP